jgi:cyclopropane fatty-acyl-phospholipid synthase-like methyltransferase
MNTYISSSSVYKDGGYFHKHPQWHTEHSAWKAAQIVKMIKRANLDPRTLCEVGCGAGEVLRLIQERISSQCSLRGFDISPQAISLSQARANDRLQFELIEYEGDINGYYDLLVSVDVVEHVENYLGFLRCLRSKATYKIFHVPLDLSVQSILRSHGLIERRDSHNHLHYFSKEVFLRSLTDAGYKVCDVLYTKRSIEIGLGREKSLMNVPRRIGFTIAPDFTVRVLGGFSLAVLAV